MNQSIKNVSLSLECSEDWDSFKPNGDSKFCEKCKHAVVDFSNATQAELDERVKNSEGHLCGRFTISQLSSEFLKYAAASAIVASSLSSISCAPEIIEPKNVKPAEVKKVNGPKVYRIGRFRY